MTTPPNDALPRILLILCLPLACAAQLTGQFQFDFSNSPALWDFSGAYSHSNGAIRSEYTLTHALSGAITGAGRAHYDNGVTRIDATQSASGRVSGGAAWPVRVNAAGNGAFSGTALGRPISGPFNGSLSLTLDAPGGVLAGTESATACLRGRGCQTLVSNVSFSLPADMDGSWTLALNIMSTGRVVRGTAVATLSNGRPVSFNVRGRYVLADGTSLLTLNGTGSAFGRRLLLRADATGRLQTLRGQLFGQHLVFP